MARKLAILFYKLHTEGLEYVKKNIEQYKKELMKRKRKNLSKIAKELNVQFVDNKAYI